MSTNIIPAPHICYTFEKSYGINNVAANSEVTLSSDVKSDYGIPSTATVIGAIACNTTACNVYPYVIGNSLYARAGYVSGQGGLVGIRLLYHA